MLVIVPIVEYDVLYPNTKYFAKTTNIEKKFNPRL